MSFIRGASVLFLSIILILLFILFSTSLIVNSLLHPNVYLEAFEQGGVYEYIDDNLDKAQGATFIEIPQEGSKPMIASLLSNFLSYLRSDTDALEISVKIDTEKLRNFFLQQINNLPNCTLNQEPFNEDDPCIPVNKDQNEFLDEFLQRKNLSFFDKDEVDLTSVYGLDLGSEGRNALDKIREVVKYYQFASVIVGGAICLIILLIYLIKKNNKSFYRVISVALFLAGAVFFVITKLANNLPKILNFSEPILEATATSIISTINRKIIIYGAIMLSLSIILFLYSFIKRNKFTDKNKDRRTKR